MLVRIIVAGSTPLLADELPYSSVEQAKASSVLQEEVAYEPVMGTCSKGSAGPELRIADQWISST
jgi:hypothetical protein